MIENTVQSTEDKEQSVEPPVSKSTSPAELNKEAEVANYCPEENTNSVNKTSPPRSQFPCTDLLDNSDPVDGDSDEELPSFDLFSSLEMENV